MSPTVERVFRRLQRSELSRGGTLELIPMPADRGGGLGTVTYGEWCYTVGFFQSLIFQHLPKRPIRMLDVGCGVGRLYLAARPYLGADDKYLGIDVGKSFIDICRRLYPYPNCAFTHIDASNPYYAKKLKDQKVSWPLEDSQFNLITALSVWTHLNEGDWRFYLNEVGRKLSDDGRAIISFFILDDHYKASLAGRSGKISAYYPQPSNKWIFDTPAYDSPNWYYPKWATVPETAIGVEKAAFDTAVAEAGLKVVSYFPGSWKEQPGLFFQDIVVFEKLDKAG